MFTQPDWVASFLAERHSSHVLESVLEMHDAQCLEILQRLATAAPERTRQLLCMPGVGGRTVLDEKFSLYMPLLQQLAPQQPDLVAQLLMSKTHDSGPSILEGHFAKCRPLLMNLMETKPELLIQIFSSSELATFVRNPDNFIFFTPILKEFAYTRSDLLAKFLAIKGNHGTLLEENFRECLPFLESLANSESKLLAPFFADRKKPQNSLSTSLMNYNKESLTFLKKIATKAPELFLSIFSQNSSISTNEMLLQYFNIEPLFVEIANSKPELVVDFFINNPLRIIGFEKFIEKKLITKESLVERALPLAFCSISLYAQLFPKIKKLIPDHVNDFFLLLGSAPLFKKNVVTEKDKALFISILPLIQKLLPTHMDELVHFLYTPNPLGASPIELYKHQIPKELWSALSSHIYGIDLSEMHISKSWLKSDKFIEEAVSLTQVEYKKKAIQMQKDVDSLWNTLHFGTDKGQVPPSYLIENRSPEEIKQKLNIMINRMINLTAWLGTPHEKDQAGLLAFYGQMVTNFEIILENIRNKSKNEIAAALIDIAKVEADGRCAAAYQSEIEQKKMLLTNEYANMTPEAVFRKQVNTILSDVNEKIVRSEYDSDVHALTMINFFVKLVRNPDPLAPRWVNKEMYRTLLNNVLDAEKMVTEFINSSSKVGVEVFYNWFTQNMPSDFKTENSIQFQTVQNQESEYLNAVKQELKQLDLPEETIENLTKLFSSPQYVKVVNLQEKWENKLGAAGVQQMLSQDDAAWQAKVVPPAIHAIDAFIKESPGFKAIAQDSSFSKQKRLLMEKKYVDSVRADFYAQHALNKKIAEAMRPTVEIEPLLPQILQIKTSFDDKIEALGNSLSPSYDRKIEGLPSQKIEFLKRADYAKRFFKVLKGDKTEGDTTGESTDPISQKEQKSWELSPTGAVIILKSIGVLS